MTLLLRQHVGKPAVPVVRTGDRVHAGDVVAEIPEKSLGARIHAPIDGIVTVSMQSDRSQEVKAHDRHWRGGDGQHPAGCASG